MHYREILFTPRCSPRAREFPGSVDFSVRRTVAELRGVKLAQFSDFGLCRRYMRSIECPSSLKIKSIHYYFTDDISSAQIATENVIVLLLHHCHCSDNVGWASRSYRLQKPAPNPFVIDNWLSNVNLENDC